MKGAAPQQAAPVAEDASHHAASDGVSVDASVVDGLSVPDEGKPSLPLASTVEDDAQNEAAKAAAC